MNELARAIYDNWYPFMIPFINLLENCWIRDFYNLICIKNQYVYLRNRHFGLKMTMTKDEIDGIWYILYLSIIIIIK